MVAGKRYLQAKNSLSFWLTAHEKQISKQKWYNWKKKININGNKLDELNKKKKKQKNNVSILSLTQNAGKSCIIDLIHLLFFFI